MADFLGCQKCGTVLFQLKANPTGRAGVFTHERVAMDGVDKPGDGKICPVDGCGAAIVRVPAPQ